MKRLLILGVAVVLGACEATAGLAATSSVIIEGRVVTITCQEGKHPVLREQEGGAGGGLFVKCLDAPK